jgi:hypothetical protein
VKGAAEHRCASIALRDAVPAMSDPASIRSSRVHYTWVIALADRTVCRVGDGPMGPARVVLGALALMAGAVGLSTQMSAEWQFFVLWGVVVGVATGGGWNPT